MFKLIKKETCFCKLEDLVNFFKEVTGISVDTVVEVYYDGDDPGKGNFFVMDIPVLVEWDKLDLSNVEENLRADKSGKRVFRLDLILFYLRRLNRLPACTVAVEF